MLIIWSFKYFHLITLYILRMLRYSLHLLVMPIIKSAIKRVKQQQKRTTRNVRLKREVRQAVKSLQANVAAKDKKKTEENLKSVYSVLDKAVKRNLYHKNKTARMKAKYTKITREVVGKSPATKKSAPKKTAKAKTKN
ncbi:30S ribosomal protein S20 [Candidatus Saccharibacteria bacterium CPR2]|nr:30S ribosomal protein S20 [Candidatus Saccharibacteria bacterium CPR2]